VIARQTGHFRALSGLSGDQRTKVIDQICGVCVRVPTWHDGRSGAIPCAEACNIWLTEALALLPLDTEPAIENAAERPEAIKDLE